MDKMDFKKADKDLYQPPVKPTIIDVPDMTFIMVDGKGDPNEQNGAYAHAVGLLYALSYTIKMSKLGGCDITGYYDYVVPPLEGLWWFEDGLPWREGEKSAFCWTAMIRQPEFVTPDVFKWAISETEKKKPELEFEKARLTGFKEGLCVQCMHLGPYDAEPETVKKMDTFMRENDLVADFSDKRRHHEIYMNDPRRSKPEKVKTVIRHPVKYS